MDFFMSIVGTLLGVVVYGFMWLVSVAKKIATLISRNGNVKDGKAEVAENPALSAAPMPEFDHANRYYLIVLNASFGVTVAVYKGELRPTLRAWNAFGLALMKAAGMVSGRLAMPTLAFQPDEDIRTALFAIEQEASRMTCELLRFKDPDQPEAPMGAQIELSGSARPPAGADLVQSEAPADQHQWAPVSAADSTKGAEPSQAAQEPPRWFGADRPKKNSFMKVAGIVDDFGMVPVSYPGSKSSEIFQVELQLANGERANFRGIRLQELFKQLEINVGDEVEITPMGSVAVPKQGALGARRNEYAVTILHRATSRVAV